MAHEELKKQYEADALWHPRPWERGKAAGESLKNNKTETDNNRIHADRANCPAPTNAQPRPASDAGRYAEKGGTYDTKTI